MKTYKVLVGYIAGGRADTIARVKAISLPKDEKKLEEWFHSDECEYSPNMDEDIPEIITAIKKGKIWVGTDSFGEGVVGFYRITSPSKIKILKLKNALRAEYMGDDDDDEYEE